MDTHNQKSNRARFDGMKKAMGWTWSDIGQLIGRAYARQNMTKGVPAWAMLAVEVYEKQSREMKEYIIPANRLTDTEIYEPDMQAYIKRVTNKFCTPEQVKELKQCLAQVKAHDENDYPTGRESLDAFAKQDSAYVSKLLEIWPA